MRVITRTQERGCWNDGKSRGQGEAKYRRVENVWVTHCSSVLLSRRFPLASRTRPSQPELVAPLVACLHAQACEWLQISRCSSDKLLPTKLLHAMWHIRALKQQVPLFLSSLTMIFGIIVSLSFSFIRMTYMELCVWLHVDIRNIFWISTRMLDQLNIEKSILMLHDLNKINLIKSASFGEIKFNAWHVNWYTWDIRVCYIIKTINHK